MANHNNEANPYIANTESTCPFHSTYSTISTMILKMSQCLLCRLLPREHMQTLSHSSDPEAQILNFNNMGWVRDLSSPS